MKVLIFVAALVVACSAIHELIPSPYVYHQRTYRDDLVPHIGVTPYAYSLYPNFYHGVPETYAWPYRGSFHAQDVLGQYNYGYSTLDHSKVEAKGIDGNVVGRYSYIDGHGVSQDVHYTAGVDGFRVVGTNLPEHIPKPVVDTPEVMKARAEHSALFEKEKLEHNIKRRDVGYTPEVAAARADHLARHAYETARNEYYPLSYYGGYSPYFYSDYYGHYPYSYYGAYGRYYY